VLGIGCYTDPAKRLLVRSACRHGLIHRAEA
jgi:hypothetical protein